MSDWFFHMDEEDFQTFLMEEAAEKHIEEVTSMELPLDWDNYYDTDESAAGVHAESRPDGLVKCLNTMEKNQEDPQKAILALLSVVGPQKS